MWGNPPLYHPVKSIKNILRRDKYWQKLFEKISREGKYWQKLLKKTLRKGKY